MNHLQQIHAGKYNCEFNKFKEFEHVEFRGIAHDILKYITHVVDIECYYVKGEYYYRELSIYDLRKMEIDCFQIYDETMPPKEEFTRQDRRQIWDMIFNIHGLRLLEKTNKKCRTREWIMNYLNGLNNIDGLNCVFGYKGGSIEKTLCIELNIPAINLEHFGALKYEALCRLYKLDERCCEAHLPRGPHCSKSEVCVFTAFVFKILEQQQSFNKILEQYENA